MLLDDEIHLDWQAPRGDTATVLAQLQNQVNELQHTVATLSGEFNPVKGALYDAVLPRTDKLAIRCLLDVFLDKQGYSPQSCGPRRAWVTANKATISQATGIPEGHVERLFQCASLLIYFPAYFDSRAYSDEGDESTHKFRAETVAHGLKRVTKASDGDDLRTIYSTALCSTIEDEIEGKNPHVTILRGGILAPGESRVTVEPKPFPYGHPF